MREPNGNYSTWFLHSVILIATLVLTNIGKEEESKAQTMFSLLELPGMLTGMPGGDLESS
jgi:hypothetical protein